MKSISTQDLLYYLNSAIVTTYPKRLQICINGWKYFKITKAQLQQIKRLKGE